MKKRILLMLAAWMFLSFTACGSGTGNADHDYVIALMEKGDYDMAITVLEHLREQSAGDTPSASAADAEKVPPAATPAVTKQPEVSAPARNDAANGTTPLLVDAVNRFLSEKGQAMMDSYRNNIGEEPGPVSVSHAMKYHMPDCDGHGSDANCLLIHLTGNFHMDAAIFDSIQLLLDLDTGELYDSTEVDWERISACGGIPSDKEVFHMIAANAYYSYILSNGQGPLWSDKESCEVLTADDLAGINEGLN